MAAWPVVARGQHAMPVVGFLHASAPETTRHVVTAFLKGLQETGYVEGRNVAIEYRWAYSDFRRLPELAADLVRRKVAVLVATGGAGTALAAKAATSTIPIVFTSGGDPVEFGLVASLSHPGGNATGLSVLLPELSGKQLELLKAAVPRVTRVTVLYNPVNPAAALAVNRTREVARELALQLQVLEVRQPGDLQGAFAALLAWRAAGFSKAICLSRRPCWCAAVCWRSSSSSRFSRL